MSFSTLVFWRFLARSPYYRTLSHKFAHNQCQRLCIHLIEKFSIIIKPAAQTTNLTVENLTSAPSRATTKCEKMIHKLICIACEFVLCYVRIKWNYSSNSADDSELANSKHQFIRLVAPFTIFVFLSHVPSKSRAKNIFKYGILKCDPEVKFHIHRTAAWHDWHLLPLHFYVSSFSTNYASKCQRFPVDISFFGRSCLCLPNIQIIIICSSQQIGSTVSSTWLIGLQTKYIKRKTAMCKQYPGIILNVTKDDKETSSTWIACWFKNRSVCVAGWLCSFPLRSTPLALRDIVHLNGTPYTHKAPRLSIDSRARFEFP